MDFFRYLIIGMGNLLLAQASAAHAPADPPPAAATAPPLVTKCAPADLSSPWFIILNAPEDMDAFWQRIERPDLMVIKADQLPNKDARDGCGGKAR